MINILCSLFLKAVGFALIWTIIPFSSKNLLIVVIGSVFISLGDKFYEP